MEGDENPSLKPIPNASCQCRPNGRYAYARLVSMAARMALLPTDPGALPVVLVCDDEPVLRTLVRDALRDASCVVIEACDGKEALRLARSEQPDLMLLDMLMPGRHGMDVLAALQADPSTDKIPVIVLTAFAWPSLSDALKLYGVDCFVTKPFNPIWLAALVKDTLAGRPARVSGSSI
jgi:CheY-like chemotaxis protein